jgi:hypothetical protein
MSFKNRTGYLLIGLLVLSLNTPVFPSVYFVAGTGSDSNPGTITEPLASMQKAQEFVQPGDTVYLRGGTYAVTEADISRVYQNLFACISFIDKSGTPGAMIKYWAYPGEIPVFDLSAVTPANQRVVGLYVTADYVHFRGFEITGLQVTITTHTESYGIYSWGNHNVFERLSFHDGQGTGLRHRKGGGNLFLNCDSYRNHDYTSEDGRGSNTDGFGCHPHDGGTGNVFRGCRSWFNSDDGYDVLGAAESVTFENCWAMYNGYSVNFSSLGDGNGFKAGGYGSTTVQDLPVPIPGHTVRFCLAVRNKASGFYSNHHITGNSWYYNTAYRNGTNDNMLNRLPDNVTDVPGYGHVMRNNLSYKSSYDIRNVNYGECDIAYNSYDLSLGLTDEDFLSLDEALLVQPRNPDGSLTETEFMRLAPGSKALDKGVDIGYPFYGTAPDLGAWEQDYLGFPGANAAWYQYYYPESYWEPGRHPRYLVHGLTDQDTTIQEKSYHKLFRFGGDPPDPLNAICVGALREASDKKVWFRNFAEKDYPVPDTGEIMLYDFGVRTGDTIRNGLFTGTGYLIVSGFNAVLVNGIYRKRILFRDFVYSSWIMGMGNERGLLFPSGDLPTNGLWGDLVCFFQDGEEIFHHDGYENCYEPPSGTADLKTGRTPVRIHPNPCYDNLINVEADVPLTEILMVDASGRIVKKYPLQGEYIIRIPVNSMVSGFYLLRATGPDWQFYSSKLILNH